VESSEWFPLIAISMSSEIALLAVHLLSSAIASGLQKM